MKKVFTIFVTLLLVVSVFAQSPEKMSYQAVIRDASDNLVTNQTVGMQISILQGSASGTVVYVETQTPTSNTNGLVSLEIGTGTTSDDFSSIDWANGPYFLKTETDLAGGINYTITGTSQLLSVPYAFHAKTAETIAGGIPETDPVFEAWDKDYNDLINTPTIPTVPENVSDFTNDAGYLLEYIETDPEFNAWDKDYNDLINLPTITDNQTLSEVLTENNDGGATQIKNIANPTDAQDAATKAYVDQLLNLLVDNGMVVIDFTASATNITIGNSVDFTDNSVLEATSWLWDFGDGNTSTEQNPTHIYTDIGIYTVILTASNGVLSSSETKDDYITVIDVPTFNSFTDSRDGKEYQTIIIGNQEWMAENLAYLPSVVDQSTKSDAIAYCYVYDYNGTDVLEAKATANYDTYGVLYNWTAAMDGSASSEANPSGVQGVCPDGWHLPSDAEWTELIDYLGGASVAGGKLKESGTEHWDDPNVVVTTENGFAALPGGYLGTISFGSIGTHGKWWSTTETLSGDAAYNRLMYHGSSSANHYNYYKDNGLSVRCVKD